MWLSKTPNGPSVKFHIQNSTYRRSDGLIGCYRVTQRGIYIAWTRSNSDVSTFCFPIAVSSHDGGVEDDWKLLKGIAPHSVIRQEL